MVFLTCALSALGRLGSTPLRRRCCVTCMLQVQSPVPFGCRAGGLCSLSKGTRYENEVSRQGGNVAG